MSPERGIDSGTGYDVIATFVLCGLAALTIGIVAGQMQQQWLLSNFATAGAAALVVFALQAMGPWQDLRLGATTGAAAEITLLYIEVALLGALGLFLGRPAED